MKTKNIFSIAMSLALVFLVFSSCKRESVTEPSPVGPSSFSVLLTLTVSPNVIFAGDTREITSIKASLKRYDGVPLPGKTILFEICDYNGNKLPVGFLEHFAQSVTSKATNAGGEAVVNYYGPLAQELTTWDPAKYEGVDIIVPEVYIWASVAGEGKEFIHERTPIRIIQDLAALNFEVYAVPNVIMATAERPQAQVLAQVFYGTVPAAGRKVFFKILNGPGYFSDQKTTTYAYTDQYGLAKVVFIGPTKDELSYDIGTQVQAQLETADPEFVHKETYIRIIKGQ